MPDISLFGEPPTHEQIHAIRREVEENMPAMLVAKYFPIPMVDIVATLATAGVDYAINGDRTEPWRYANGAIDQDWTGSPFSTQYVAKVRAQGRPLLNIEVEALKSHVEIARTAVNVARTLAGNAADLAKDFLSDVLRHPNQEAEKDVPRG